VSTERPESLAEAGAGKDCALQKDVAARTDRYIFLFIEVCQRV